MHFPPQHPLELVEYIAKSGMVTTPQSVNHEADACSVEVVCLGQSLLGDFLPEEVGAPAGFLEAVADRGEANGLQLLEFIS